MSYADILRKGISFIAETPSPSPSPSPKPTSSNSKNSAVESNSHYYIDGGINLSHKNLSTKIQKVIQDAVAYNCRRYIIISRSVADSRKVISLVKEVNRISNNRYKLLCTVGVQPHDAERTLQNEKDTWVEELDNLISENRDIVVAVGKCGLDYDRMFASKETQIEVFKQQLLLSKKYDLPLYLHERSSQNEFLDIIENTLELQGGEQMKGYIHCFTGNENAAKLYLDKGFYIGITGRICDDSQNESLIAALKMIPLNRIIVSTDAPYMTPKDLKRRPYNNGSQFIPHISARIANIKKVKKDVLITTVVLNVRKLYGSNLE